MIGWWQRQGPWMRWGRVILAFNLRKDNLLIWIQSQTSSKGHTHWVLPRHLMSFLFFVLRYWQIDSACLVQGVLIQSHQGMVYIKFSISPMHCIIKTYRQKVWDDTVAPSLKASSYRRILWFFWQIQLLAINWEDISYSTWKPDKKGKHPSFPQYLCLVSGFNYFLSTMSDQSQITSVSEGFLEPNIIRMINKLCVYKNVGIVTQSTSISQVTIDEGLNNWVWILIKPFKEVTVSSLFHKHNMANVKNRITNLVGDPACTALTNPFPTFQFVYIIFTNCIH